MTKFEQTLRFVGGVEGIEAAVKAGNLAPLKILIDAGHETATLASTSIEKRLDGALDRESLYMRYLGVLGILGEVSVYVPEEDRETIAEAFEHACAHHPLKWRRVLDRLEIEPDPSKT